MGTTLIFVLICILLLLCWVAVCVLYPVPKVVCKECKWCGGEHDWNCSHNTSTCRSTRWGEETKGKE